MNAREYLDIGQRGFPECGEGEYKKILLDGRITCRWRADSMRRSRWESSRYPRQTEKRSVWRSKQFDRGMLMYYKGKARLPFLVSKLGSFSGLSL